MKSDRTLNVFLRGRSATLYLSSKYTLSRTIEERKRVLSEEKLNRASIPLACSLKQTSTLRVSFFWETVENYEILLCEAYFSYVLPFFLRRNCIISFAYLASVVPLTVRHSELLNSSKKSNYLTSLQTRGAERVSRSNLCHRRRGNGFFQK